LFALWLAVGIRSAKAYPIQSEADMGPWSNIREFVVELRLLGDRVADLDRESFDPSQKE
jgi:hypothetical protein